MKQSKTEQNKCNTRERRHDIYLQTKRLEDTSSRHLWLVNKGGRTSTSPLASGCPLLVLPVTFGHTTACCRPALVFYATVHFAMKCSVPCSVVLHHSHSSWAAVVYWSALMSKALRSSRKQPIRSFSCPPTQPAPPTNSPNIAHFGSLVSSMRATNPANKIRLLRKVASMLSLPVLISVSR